MLAAAGGNDPWDNNNPWNNNNNNDDPWDNNNNNPWDNNNAWENDDDDNNDDNDENNTLENDNGNENNNNNTVNNNGNTENNNTNNQPKKTRGRQKLPMKKIENDSNLQVTFSKRRAGIIKKMNELSLMCAVEAAVILFSPGNKPHSFGHPDVETVANRFLNQNAPQERADPFLAAHNRAAMQHRGEELARIEAQIERERQRRKELEEQRKNLFPRSIDQLNHDEFKELQSSILRFKKELDTKMKSVVGSENPFAHDQDRLARGVNRAHPVGPRIGPNNQLPRYNHRSSNSSGFNAGAGYPNPTNPMVGGSSSNSVLDPNVVNYGSMNQVYPHLHGASTSSNVPQIYPYMGGASTSSNAPQMYPHMGRPGTSSNVVVPYNYGYYGGNAGATTSANVGGNGEEEEEADLNDQFQGFDDNYGGDGF